MYEPLYRESDIIRFPPRAEPRGRGVLGRISWLFGRSSRGDDPGVDRTLRSLIEWMDSLQARYEFSPRRPTVDGLDTRALLEVLAQRVHVYEICDKKRTISNANRWESESVRPRDTERGVGSIKPPERPMEPCVSESLTWPIPRRPLA